MNETTLEFSRMVSIPDYLDLDDQLDPEMLRTITETMTKEIIEGSWNKVFELSSPPAEDLKPLDFTEEARPEMFGSF